jgi:hypothetical protein
MASNFQEKMLAASTLLCRSLSGINGQFPNIWKLPAEAERSDNA